MGRNSRQRRDARRRATARPRPSSPGSGSEHAFAFGGGDLDDPAELAEAHVVTELRRASQGRLQPDQGDRAAALVRRLAPLPASSVRRVVDDVVGRIVESRVDGGWCPDDLDQLLVRDGLATDRSVLAAWLRADLRASAPEDPWREQVERFPSAAPAPTDEPTDEAARIAAALHLGALLDAQPGLPTTVTRRTRRTRSTTLTGHGAATTDSGLTRKLATVRGLLAKAESTTFDEEAEALTAKAQELISRHALERLLETGPTGPAGGGAAMPGAGARRVWLEPPYVSAKAQLVHAVARANGCRAVLSDPPGACTVVGTDDDLDAVELLATSLLVQAGAAMLRHGRAVDARGTSRTRSFRQSFLMAFAVRIGERLSEAAEHVLHDSGHEQALLPVLRSRDEAVQAAFEALVPRVRTTRATVSNAAGWHAGQAAADLASIDVRRRIADA